MSNRTKMVASLASWKEKKSWTKEIDAPKLTARLTSRWTSREREKERENNDTN